MDGLVKLHSAASGMLDRIDATLTRHGAPAEHAIWPLLRRRGMLPGDAVANVAAWEPKQLLERATLCRSQRARCAEVGGLLRGHAGWDGTAGAAFEARLSVVRDEHEAFTRDAQTLADYLEDLAGWIVRGRWRLAHQLATVLVSAQSVALKVDIGAKVMTPVTRARAAADLGAEVLSEVDRFWVGALDLSHAWSGRLGVKVTAAAAAPLPDHRLRVEL